MDIRITPFTSYSSLTKKNSKTGINNNYSSFSATKPRAKKSILVLTSNKNNLTSIKKPRLTLRLTSNLNQPIRPSADKKGVLLYQQIERDNLFLNKSELVNRFNFKV